METTSFRDEKRPTGPVFLDEDDAPELTEEIIRRARPAAEVLYETLPAHIAEAILKRPGRPKADAPKKLISLRLSPEVITYFKAQGKGWQTQIDDYLKKAVNEHQ